MPGKTLLLINFILSLLVAVMFLPYFEGKLVGLMMSGAILVIALLVIAILFLSLVYSISTMVRYKIFRTASFFEKVLLIWPAFQLVVWLVLLLQ